MKLKNIIAIANSAYPDDLIKGYSENPKAKLGDGLAQFIAEELDSTYDEDVPEAEQLCQAARAVEKAASELNAVSNAFRAKLCEPLKKLEDKRRLAAQQAFESAKLPEVASTNGGWCIDGVFWTQPVFWENPDGDSIRGDFGVTFEEGTAKILDTWNQ